MLLGIRSTTNIQGRTSPTLKQEMVTQLLVNIGNVDRFVYLKIRQLPTGHSRPTFMRLTAKLYSLMRSFEICSLWTSEMLILLPTILTL